MNYIADYAKTIYSEGYRDQAIFISGLYASLGSSTYVYYW